MEKVKSDLAQLTKKRVKSLVRPRTVKSIDLVEFQSLCYSNEGDCYRRNRSIEGEDEILF